MTEYKVTIHAIQTMTIDARDAELAIKKARSKMTSDWTPMDAVAVDPLNNLFSEDLYDNRSLHRYVVIRPSSSYADTGRD